MLTDDRIVRENYLAQVGEFLKDIDRLLDADNTVAIDIGVGVNGVLIPMDGHPENQDRIG